MADNLVEKRITFHRIGALRNGTAVDIVQILKEIGNLEFKVGGRYMPLANGDMLTMYVDTNRIPLMLEFGRVRRRELPLFEKVGVISPLSPPPGTGLFEPSHAIIFPNNVMAFESTLYGPRPGTLKSYLPAVKGDLVDTVTLTDLSRQDPTEVLRRMGAMKRITITARQDIGARLQSLSRGLSAALLILSQESPDLDHVTLSLGIDGRKNGELKSIKKEGLERWIRNSDNILSLHELKISATDTETGRMVEFDLLEQFIMSKKKVMKVDESHRSVDKTAMYGAMVEAYNELHDVIDNAVEVAGSVRGQGVPRGRLPGHLTRPIVEHVKS